MESKIVIHEDQFRIKSTDLAEEIKAEHRNILTLINKYKKDLLEIGTLPDGETKNLKGRSTNFYYLNEGQTLFLSSIFKNSVKTTLLTKTLINEFAKVKGLLVEIKTAFSAFDFDNIDVRYVYIAKDQNDNIKIGISNNPERRVKELSLGNACNLELIYVKKADLPRYQNETLLHKKASKHQIKNEWFEQSAIQELNL